MKIERRKFLHLSAGIGTASVLPVKMNKSLFANKGKPEQLVGHGEFRYKVNKEWGNLDPRKYPVHHCHEMVEDRAGRLILCTTDTKNNILIYDKSGKILKAWGTSYPGAHGLTIKDEGGTEYLYLTDTVLHKVYKLTLDGRLIQTFSYPQGADLYSEEKEFVPTETAILENGEVLVADGYGKDYILRYDQSGRFLGYFGGKGDAPEQLQNAHGICIDTRAESDTLLVTSRARQEVKRFTLDGKYLETISFPGCSICRPVVHGKHVYFAVIVTKDWWSYDGMVLIMNDENKVISFPGGSVPTYEDGKLLPPEYDGSTFLNPHDVCVDRDENLYIPQWLSGKTYPVKLERI